MSALVQTWTAGETDGVCWVPNLLAEMLFSNFMLKKKVTSNFIEKIESNWMFTIFVAGDDVLPKKRVCFYLEAVLEVC